MMSFLYLCFCLCLGVTTSRGQTCDLSLVANNTQVTQEAVIGSNGLCTWIIALDDQHPQLLELAVVEIIFPVVNLTHTDNCDATNSIVVYDGDTSGRILGLVCRNNSGARFQSSGTVLTIQYSVGAVTETAAFTLQYNYVPLIRCSSFIHAVSDSEYSLVTPRYPTGYSSFRMNCDWTISPAVANERVRVTIETTSNMCQDVNVTIFGSGFKKMNKWCPGMENVYQSFEGLLNFDMDVAAGQGVKITYRRLEESTCKGTLNSTNVVTILTTPNYPQPFPSFTECQWKIDSRRSRNGSIRIEVVDMDVEETDGCVTDRLTIMKGYLYNSEIMATTCSGKPSYYVYDYGATIIFKSWRAANSRRGLNITFYHGEAEPCGGDLIASSSPQYIQSPGFPFSYPNSVTCVWKIKPSNPNNYVKVQFETMEISSFSSRCFEDFVRIHDGGHESDYELIELCGSETPTVQGSEGPLTIVFRTDSDYNKKGFNMSFLESTDPVPGFRNLKARYEDKSFTSPRFPDGQVRNLNMTWTMGGVFRTAFIQIMFKDVDLGNPEDCENNFIKVYDGDTSSPKSSTICGNESEVYLINKPTIVLKTDNNFEKRGFRADYKAVSQSRIEGCAGTTLTVSAYSTIKDSIHTPNYPDKYPNFADCAYLLEGVLDDYRVRVFIEDADMEVSGDTECQKDYFEIFDGKNTTEKSLGRVCRKTSEVFESTGRYLLITFTSDSKLSGKGGKITYEAINTVSEGTSYVWVIILVSVVGGVIIIGFVVYKIVRKSRSQSARI